MGEKARSENLVCCEEAVMKKSKTPEEREAERALFEETAFIYPSDMPQSNVKQNNAGVEDVNNNETVMNNLEVEGVSILGTESQPIEENDVSIEEIKPNEEKEVIEEIMEKEKIDPVVLILVPKDALSESEPNEEKKVLFEETMEKGRIDPIVSTLEPEDLCQVYIKETKEKEKNDPIASTFDPKDPSSELEPTEEKKVPELKADIYGIFTLVIPVYSTIGDPQKLMDDVEYDFSWFDREVSVSLVGDGEGSPVVLEVKMKDEKLVKAAMVGLKTKYSAIAVKKQVDMCGDEAGLFTLCFTDTQRKGYLATMEMFSQYGNPGISRGKARDQVFVSFLTKEEALAALLANLNNEELSLPQPAPACRLGS